MSTLVRKEVELAKTELSDTAGEIGRSAAAVAVGGFVAYAGLLILLAAAVLGLIAVGLDAWLAALIVGGVVAAVGAILVWQGISAMRNVDPAPHETVRTMKDNIEALKEPMR